MIFKKFADRLLRDNVIKVEFEPKSEENIPPPVEEEEPDYIMAIGEVCVALAIPAGIVGALIK